MFGKSIIFIVVSFILWSSPSYAEKEYTATVTGCYDPGGTMGTTYFRTDNNEQYELAMEEMEMETMGQLFECNCNDDKICKVTFVYTTDSNDFDEANTKGLIRKFKSITTK